MSGNACVTGCVLAGGEGRRLGGRDKGLVELGGRPLVSHVIGRLRPQVSALVISANRNLATYAGFGLPVFDDARDDYAGPLAGCLGALRRATTRYVVTAACDSPFLPHDLVARLLEPLVAAAADIAVVATDDRLQPVFALYDVRLAGSLAAYLDDGGRKIDTWLRRHHLVEVDFSSDAEAFININTPDELARAGRRLADDA
ncbi:MAG: molybdenum cofactor guanylyltransferase MobA [Gammaproteobacteria bacterium]